MLEAQVRFPSRDAFPAEINWGEEFEVKMEAAEVLCQPGRYRLSVRSQGALG